MFVVMRKENRAISTNIYMAFLAVCDTVVLMAHATFVLVMPLDISLEKCTIRPGNIKHFD